MPTLCRPVAEGGIGFDYRLSMGPPVSMDLLPLVTAVRQTPPAIVTAHRGYVAECAACAMRKLCNWTSTAASGGNQLLHHLKPHRLCTQCASSTAGLASQWVGGDIAA